MPHDQPTIVVSDTSVLINFLRIDRMELIAGISYDFVVTDHVGDEVSSHYPDQQARYLAALRNGTLQERAVIDPEAVEMFGSLSALGSLGAGECSAIALAVCRGFALAIDDRRALNQARRVGQNLQILKTRDLVLAMIRENLLDVREADVIKDLWASKHRFQLGLNSFAQLIAYD